MTGSVQIYWYLFSTKESGWKAVALSTIYKVTALLFSQSYDNIVPKSEQKTTFGTPLLTGWFFGCFILMTNLYSGEIFSCLSLSYPLQVPRTLDALVDSGVIIVTQSAFYNTMFRDSSLLSTLKDKIIPDFMFNAKGNHKFINFLTRINNNIFFAKSICADDWKPIVGKNKSYAIMDVPEVLDYFVDYAEAANPNGEVLVDNNDETPFYSITMDFSRRNNFFTKKLKLVIRKLMDSGISSKWDAIRRLRDNLRKARNVKNFDYKKLLAIYMAGGFRPAIFSKFQPVSFLAVKYVVILCGILLDIETIIFTSECVVSTTRLVAIKKSILMWCIEVSTTWYSML